MSVSHVLPEAGTPFIILGADAVLAALPASPVQLAHACQALGYQLAAPATWGDELIAERCLERLADYEHPAAVMCSCPLVTQRLTRASTALEPFMLTFASPPVATARYLRSAFEGQSLHITYAGACPGAENEAIDARMSPSALLDAFDESGIALDSQPNCFDALVPLDRRRFYSIPGGVPARDHLDRSAHRALVELSGDDLELELTQQLIEQPHALLDLALPLGCACAGAGDHALRGNARGGLLMLEPPRARKKVLDPSVHVDVAETLIEACSARISARAPDGDLDVQAPAAVEAPHVQEHVPEHVQEHVPEHVQEHVPEAESLAVARAHKRRFVTRSSASIPLYATDAGEVVPRASLAVLQRALRRIAARRAQRLPKIERPRRDRAVELRDTAGRSVSRTPRSLAIPPLADLPRPAPPPPPRHRPRAALGLGL